MKKTLLVAAGVMLNGASAWHDEGHAVAMMVTKLSLDDAEVKKVEDLLALWEDWYPGVSSFEHLAIWSDNLRCTGDTSRCNFARFDGMKVLDETHWTSNAYVPSDRVSIKGKIYEFYPLPGVGGAWAVNETYTALTFGGNPTDESGTILSTNLHLRALTHSYTDAHMPCHTCETFAEPHPDGDVGANLWTLDWENCAQLKDHADPAKNLHSLWDSLAMTWDTYWPELTESYLKTKAEALMVKHTKQSFGARLTGDLDGTKIDPIVAESFKMAQDEVFEEFDFTVTSGDPVELPYCPSVEYINNLKDVAEKQVVIAGYRLAVLMKEIIAALPTAAQVVVVKP